MNGKLFYLLLFFILQEVRGGAAHGAECQAGGPVHHRLPPAEGNIYIKPHIFNVLFPVLRIRDTRSRIPDPDPQHWLFSGLGFIYFLFWTWFGCSFANDCSFVAFLS